jgi:hypothetical protein
LIFFSYIFANIANYYVILKRMAEAKSIESLSLFFTAGAAAGSLLAGSSAGYVCAILLPLAALP